MKYLLDTNVICDLLCAKPNKNVTNWFARIPSDELFLSVLTLGEIRRGVELRSDGKRKVQLMVWLEHELPKWFMGRILPINHQIADKWGYVMATTKKTTPAIDGLLAATALTYGLTMVTRNAKDFKIAGLEVINPFQED